MAEPENMIIPLLQEMRAETASNFETVNDRLSKMDARLDKMGEALVTFRQAPSADSYFGNVVAGEFMDRMEVFERRLSALEKLK